MSRPTISEFGIGNFRAIADIQHIPLRPITLLFGANSSGKSSFLRGFQLAAAILRQSDDWIRLFLDDRSDGLWKPEIGNGWTFLHDPDTSVKFFCTLPVANILEVPIDALAVEAGFPHIPDEWIKILRHAVSEAAVVGGAWKFHAVEGGPHFGGGAISRHAEALLIDPAGLNFEEAEKVIGPRVLDALEPWFSSVPGSAAAFQEARGALANGITRPEFEDFGENSTHRGNGGFGLASPGVDVIKDLLGNSTSRPLVDSVWENVGIVLRLLAAAVRCAFVAQTKALRTLGPLRAVPPRLGASSDPGEAGGDAWRRLIDEPELRQEASDWLAKLAGDTNSLTLRLGLSGPELPRAALPSMPLTDALLPIAERFLADYLRASSGDATQIHHDAADLHASDIASRWVERIRKTESGDDSFSLRLLRGDSKRAIAIRDTGLGMSQLIPVVVELLGNQRIIVTIEQPELHLHPAMQAEVGDLLIESALGRPQNMILAETHSEHLLLRIMRRIRETTDGRNTRLDLPVRPEDVSLVFFEMVDGNPVARHIPLDERGMITRPWPGGFFEEGFREIFA